MVLIGLLLAATAAFVSGVAAERSTTSTSASSAATASPGTGETAAERASSGETAAEGSRTHETAESTGGFRLESTGSVVAAVIISLLLAAAIAVQGSRVVLLFAAVFCLLFAGLDAREVGHQLQDSRAGVATLAGLAAVLHVGVVPVAVRLVWPMVWARGSAGARKEVGR